LQKAAQLSKHGDMTNEAKNLFCTFVMAKLSVILSDAADFIVESK
jgi:hypothetical protein